MNVKAKDLELWEIWNKTRSKKDLAALLEQLKPIILTEVRRQSGTLPGSALMAEAYNWTIKAVEAYDPNKGAAVSTYVTGYLRKLRRLNYQHQNMSRLPENQQIKFGTYNTAVQDLQAQLNRDPTDKELAGQLGWKQFEVKRMKDRLVEDLAESGSDVSAEFTSFGDQKILVNHIRDNLDDSERVLFDNAYLPKGTRKSNTDLANNLNVNINKLQYIRTKMTRKIRGLQSEMGDWSN